MTLNVNTGELQELASGLSGLVGEIESAGSQITSIDAGAAGHPTLISAIEDFRGLWASAVGDMQGKVGRLADNVVSSADAYDQADLAVRAAFER